MSKRALSRRTLLKGAGAALAGAALRPAGLMAADTAPRKVRIGVVGGNFGAGFDFHRHPDCKVAAVSDLVEARRAGLMRTYGCNKAYACLEELVRDPNIDAVAIFSGAPVHVEHAVEAMRHGKHVLSAVPAALGSLEDAELLLETVKKTGLTYMVAETSHFQQFTISARKMYQEGRFGEIIACHSGYLHDGLESLYFENRKRTWRHGLAPMHYPTHCTAHLVSVTGERLTEVRCWGWGNDDPICRDNIYGNPFWNETAVFNTDKGHHFLVRVWWDPPQEPKTLPKELYSKWWPHSRGGEYADWVGTKMVFDPAAGTLAYPEGPMELDADGNVKTPLRKERFVPTQWWKTDMLPEPLRHDSGHEGSHTFITHEFVDALAHGRRPVVDIYEALSYAVPGIIAHQSALKGGEAMKIPVYRRPA